MLEFRLIEHFNRNYNTIEKTLAKQAAITFSQCLLGLQLVRRSPMATVKTSSNDCFPIIGY
jgi:hypothetical protein